MRPAVYFTRDGVWIHDGQQQEPYRWYGDPDSLLAVLANHPELDLTTARLFVCELAPWDRDELAGGAR